jgi:hypothetical protein
MGCTWVLLPIESLDKVLLNGLQVVLPEEQLDEILLNGLHLLLIHKLSTFCGKEGNDLDNEHKCQNARHMSEQCIVNQQLTISYCRLHGTHYVCMYKYTVIAEAF